MFHIDTEVKDSDIHGKGLFTREAVNKGDRIYTKEPEKKEIYTDKELAELPEDKQKEVRHFAPKNKNDGLWKLSHDEMRYCNHARPGNITNRGDAVYALRDINAGEELTQDYTELEGTLRKEVID